MIPLRDNIPTKLFPYINYILIAVNILVFIFELTMGPKLNHFISAYGVTPAKFLAIPGISMAKITPLFTSMFLHAGFLHIGGNMLFLFIFGDNVEDSMGHFRYLTFYLLVGLLSGLAHVYANPASVVSSLGASGAIAGVLGAFILMYPRAKVYTMVFLFILITIVELPAFLFIGLWFLLQLVSGISSLAHAAKQAGGVAYFAHIGGFVSGIVLILFFRKRKPTELAEYAY